MAFFVLLKQIFQFFTEALLGGHIGGVAGFFKFAKQVFLGRGEVFGNFDLHGKVEVSSAAGADYGNAPSFQRKLGACLSAFGNFETFFSSSVGI